MIGGGFVCSMLRLLGNTTVEMAERWRGERGIVLTAMPNTSRNRASFIFGQHRVMTHRCWGSWRKPPQPRPRGSSVTLQRNVLAGLARRRRFTFDGEVDGGEIDIFSVGGLVCVCAVCERASLLFANG